MHPPRLLFRWEFASLPVYSALPFYLKLEYKKYYAFNVYNSCLRNKYKSGIRNFSQTMLLKMIASEIADLKTGFNIFLSYGNVIFRFWDINVFMFETVLTTWRVVVSWWELAHEVEHVLEYNFWISNNLDIKLRQLISIIMGNIFKKKCTWFGGLDSRSKPFSIYQLTTVYQKTNYDEIIFFYFFESVHWDVIKM